MRTGDGDLSRAAASHPQLVIDEPAAAVWAAQMNTDRLPPVAVARRGHRQPRPAAHRPRPAAGHRLRGRDPGRARAADGARRGGPRPRSSRPPATAACTSSRRSSRRTSSIDVRHAVIAAARELERRMPDAVTTAWWKEERGEQHLRRLQPGQPRPHDGRRLQPARARRMRRSRRPLDWDELESADPTRVHRSRTVPERLRTTGDPWAELRRAAAARIDDAAAVVGARPRRTGSGELPFPPDYPEDAGRAAAGAAEPRAQDGLSARYAQHVDRGRTRSAARAGRRCRSAGSRSARQRTNCTVCRNRQPSIWS